MSDIAIRVENLSKQYRIGGPQVPYKTIRESLTEAVQAPFRRAAKLLRGQAYGAAGLDESIWALRNVSFEVKQGEVIGIIGRNGMGKTTLLRILSRITEPTDGHAIIRGRVASLLEVGTGFHAELTGRENIYLNGAILGMKKAEIERKFDEIVAFAEVERFIDTPVKHFSTGMYLRLAFAVAAHLDPEILLVDEVLAVGDVEFRRKCLGKMQEVSSHGRTVLFVSHNMPSIESLCDRAVLLVDGQISFDGNTATAVTRYLGQQLLPVSALRDLSAYPGRITGSEPVFKSIRLLNSTGKETGVFRMGEGIAFEIRLDEQRHRLSSPTIIIAVDDDRGRRVCSFISDHMIIDPFEISGDSVVRCYWDECRLLPGTYFVKLNLKYGGVRLDTIEKAISFEVQPSDLYGTGKIGSRIHGVFVPSGRWSLCH